MAARRKRAWAKRAAGRVGEGTALEGKIGFARGEQGKLGTKQPPSDPAHSKRRRTDPSPPIALRCSACVPPVVPPATLVCGDGWCVDPRECASPLSRWHRKLTSDTEERKREKEGKRWREATKKPHPSDPRHASPPCHNKRAHEASSGSEAHLGKKRVNTRPPLAAPCPDELPFHPCPQVYPLRAFRALIATFRCRLRAFFSARRRVSTSTFLPLIGASGCPSCHTHAGYSESSIATGSLASLR